VTNPPSTVTLTVHGIGTPVRPLDPGEDEVWVTVKQFEDVLDAVAGRADVRLTFDDANASDVEIALPHLVKRGLTAQFFLPAGLLGRPGRLTDENVRELVDAGMTLGSHGWAHCDWRQLSPVVRRAFRCRCERPVFFGNTRCLACNAELGYDAARATVCPLEPSGAEGVWRRHGDDGSGPRYRRCGNFNSAVVCSWLLEIDADAARVEQCRSCRLNRTLPDLSQPDNQRLWARVERDKQRMVASLIALGLPVAARSAEDAERGLAFDLLRGSAAPEPVITGHLNGVITLDIDEADDARREAIRESMDEPYRTVLGHLRHEIGHYYQPILVRDWDRCRELFGDDREDYQAALDRHYREGPPADWPQRHVSAYATMHPWEDWAETFAHYLHIRDVLQTAVAYGVSVSGPALAASDATPLYSYPGAAPDDLRAMLDAWFPLTYALNAINRSLGESDLYPFVLAPAVIDKLVYIDGLIRSA